DPDSPLKKFSLVHWLAEKKVAYYMSHNDPTYQEWINKYPDLAGAKDAHSVLSYVPSTAPEQGAPILNKLSDGILFELALFIGVIHLCCSFSRYARRNWNGVGWVCFLIGVYLYIAYNQNSPSILNYVGGINLETGGKVGLQLIFGGI